MEIKSHLLYDAVTRGKKAVNDIVNLRDYGATGDGTTDDRAALIAAFAALTGGGTLEVPPGTYRISSALPTFSGQKNIHLKGHGWQTSKFLCNGGFVVATDDSDQWTVSDLFFENNTSTNTNTCFNVTEARRWLIERCYFDGFGGDSIKFIDSIHSQIRFNYFLHGDTSNTNGNAAIYITSGAGFPTTTVTFQNYIGASKGYGILIEDASACASYNDIMEGCNKGMRIDACTNHQLYMPYFENNTAAWEINDSNVTWVGPTTEDEPTVTWSSTGFAQRVLTRINRDDTKFGPSVSVSSGESSGTAAFKFINTGVVRAYMEHTESTNTLRVDSDGAITIAPSNAVAATALANGGFAVANRLDLPSVTTDPSNLVDGSMWYENDVDLVRARVKGVTEGLGFLPKVDQRTSDTGTINSTTLVTLCTLTLNPGTYYFHADLGITGNATASTPGFNLQGTAVTSAYRWIAQLGILGIGTNSSGTTLPSSTSGIGIGSIGTNTNQLPWVVTGTFTITTAGTVIVAMSRTAGTGTFVGKAGSTFFAARTA